MVMVVMINSCFFYSYRTSYIHSLLCRIFWHIKDFFFVFSQNCTDNNLNLLHLDLLSLHNENFWSIFAICFFMWSMSTRTIFFQTKRRVHSFFLVYTLMVLYNMVFKTLHKYLVNLYLLILSCFYYKKYKKIECIFFVPISCTYKSTWKLYWEIEDNAI